MEQHDKQDLEAQFQFQAPQVKKIQKHQYESGQVATKSYFEAKENEEDDRDLQKMTQKELFEYIAQAEKEESLQENIQSVNTIVNSLQQKLVANQEVRQLYRDTPDKFMESQFQLHQAIEKLANLSDYPSLIEHFLKSNGLQLLSRVLQHENAEMIVSAAVHVFHEILVIEQQELAQPEQKTELLIEQIPEIVNGMFENRIFEQLVDILFGIKELGNLEKNNQAYKQILFIIQSALQYGGSQFSGRIGTETQFLNWVVDVIIGSKQEDLQIGDFKLHTSQILILMLNNTESRDQFLSLNGVQVILENIAVISFNSNNLQQIILKAFRNKVPDTQETKQMVRNLFNSLNFSLMDKQFQSNFLKLEGQELMIILIKNKVFCALDSLKCLNYSILVNEESSDHLVDINSLSILAPILMKKGLKGHKKSQQMQIDEMITSIFRQLLKNCQKNQERVLHKFRESQYEQIDRLFQIHDLYYEKVKDLDKQYQDPKFIEDYKDTWLIEDDQQFQEQIYLKQLSEGLSVLQAIDDIIAFLSGCQEKDVIKLIVSKQIIILFPPSPYYLQICQKISNLFDMLEGTKSQIEYILEQITLFIDQDAADEKVRITNLLNNLQLVK